MDFVSVLISLVLGIFTNRVDDALVSPGLEGILNRLKQDEKDTSQELEKSIKICVLSALQAIVRECHQELMGSSSIHRYRGAIIYSGEHKSELQWLDNKLKQLTKELKLVKQNLNIENSLTSIDEITVLLEPESQLIGTVQVVREKIVAQGLKDSSTSVPVPECYKKRVEAALFERVQENFALEIHHNSLIKDIVETKLLANINARLTEQKPTIKNLAYSTSSQEKNMSEARRTVKLEFDIQKLDTARLEAIIKRLQELLDDGSIQLRRIEEGCMELIFDGSEESLKKLDALFKSGKLTEILDIPVKDVRNIDESALPEQRLINLGEWLHNAVTENWKTLEEVLGTQQENLVFARGNASEQSITRAQYIYVGVEIEEISLVLVVTVKPTSTKAIDIRLQVHSNTSKTLPQGLKCNLIDLSGEKILEVEAQESDKWIELNVSGYPGEKFSIKIQSADTVIERNFVI